jgi:hypothetical protein
MIAVTVVLKDELLVISFDPKKNGSNGLSRITKHPLGYG